jgi:hypothetical protein
VSAHSTNAALQHQKYLNDTPLRDAKFVISSTNTDKPAFCQNPHAAYCISPIVSSPDELLLT